MSESKENSQKEWFPLESNPTVMNSYIQRLGVDMQKCPLEFTDVFGVDPDLLMMVSQPVHAVLLVFPINEETEKENAEACAKICETQEGQQQPSFFIKQTIGNACGTIGLLHALCNAASVVSPSIAQGSFLSNFMSKCAKMSPSERADYLEKDDSLEESQAVSAQEGQSKNKSIDEKINLHFICFIHFGGVLYEMDGRKPFPLPRGATTQDSLLADSMEVVKKYFAMGKGSSQFGITALAGKQSWEKKIE